MRLPSIPVASSAELLEKLDHRTEVVGVDEAQFFDAGIVAVCQRMADQGKRVIVAGLDKDYRGAPFEPIPSLMAVAEDVTKTLAICMRCGSPANNTQRLVESDERVVVGAQGLYEARCRRCFEPPDAPDAEPREIAENRCENRRPEFSEDSGGKPCRNACGKD